MFSAILEFFSNLIYTIMFVAGWVLLFACVFAKPILSSVTGGASMLASPLIGILSKVGKVIAVIIIVYSGGHLYLTKHDAALQAQWVIEQRLAVDEAVDAQRRLGDSLVAQAIEDTKKHFASTQAIKRVITNEARSNPERSPVSPAITSAHAELLRRQSCASGDKTACASGATPAVQPPAHTP